MGRAPRGNLGGDAIDFHSEAAGRFAAEYEGLEENPFSTPFRYGRWRLRELLAKLFPERSDETTVVDVGAGTGEDAVWLLKRGYEVCAIEPSEEMRKLAAARHPLLKGKIVAGLAEQLPIKNNRVDVVVMVEVLRYLKDLQAVALEIARVVRVGGRWVFTVTPPTAFHLGPLLNWLRCHGIPLPGVQPLRQYWHSARMLRRVLGEAGFEIVGIWPLCFLDFPAVVIWHISNRIGTWWIKTFHPVWSYMERCRWLAFGAGYYVVEAVFVGGDKKSEARGVRSDI